MALLVSRTALCRPKLQRSGIERRRGTVNLTPGVAAHTQRCTQLAIEHPIREKALSFQEFEAPAKQISSTGKTDKSRRKPWPCDIKARSKPCSPCKIKMVRIYFSIKDTVVLLLATKIEPIVIPYNVSRWILFFLVRLVLRDRTCWWKWHMSLSPSVWMLLMYAVPFFLRLGLRWCRVHILTNDQAKHPFGRVHNR